MNKEARFQCGLCEKIRISYFDASTCCASVQEGAICGECGQFYTDEDLADECCQDAP